MFHTQSEFSLNASNPNFPINPVNNKLVTQSAFVVLTDEFFSGETNALEILFFTEPITEEGKSDILHNDGKTLRKKDHVIMVFFIDKKNDIWQVDLTYVITGTTVVRTVAWKPEDVKQFFSDYLYDGTRLRLKSVGTFDESESDQGFVHLTWKVDLDVPVFDKLTQNRP